MTVQIPRIEDFKRVVGRPAGPMTEHDRVRERWDIARATPGTILLTPSRQAAKNLADVLIAQHPDMHEACDVLERTMDRDMEIVQAGGSPEAIKTAEDRLDLHRLAIAFICAHHWRAGTVPPTFDDEPEIDIPAIPQAATRVR